jgi:phosphate transport system substrate-binding protein
MRKFRGILISAALVAASLVGAQPALAENIAGSGSSYAGKMFRECIAGYTKHTVSYPDGGSGRGKRDFAAGITAFGASDSLYSAAETKPRFKFTYIPAVAGPIAVAYNAPELRTVRMSPKLIGDIFLGRVTKWNDRAIAAENKGVSLPNQKITVIYRKDNSGTTNNFANWLSQTASKTDFTQNDSWESATGNKAVGIGGNTTSGVKAELQKIPYSIGYLDLADALEAKFGTVSVRNGAGKYVKPTVATARAFLASQQMKANGAVVFDYNKVAGQDASGKKTTNFYSIVLVAYAMAQTSSTGQDTAKTLAAKDFLTYVVNDCVPAKGAKLGYVAFSGSFLKTANRLIATIK